MSIPNIEVMDEDRTISIDDDWSSLTLTFYPERKEFDSHRSINDDCFYINEIYEYKINTNPIEVFVRLKYKSIEPPLKEEVKDGVVLESILEAPSEYHRKELLERLNKEIEWQKLNLAVSYAEIFFILSLHSDSLSREDYRKYLRQTVERIKMGLNRIEDKVKDATDSDLQIVESEYGKNIWFKKTEDLSDSEREEKADFVKKNFDDLLFEQGSQEFCGISQFEFRNSSEILKHLEFLLDQREKPKVEHSGGWTMQTIIKSLLLTFVISWFISLFVDINPVLIFVIVQAVAFLQSAIGSYISK